MSDNQNFASRTIRGPGRERHMVNRLFFNFQKMRTYLVDYHRKKRNKLFQNKVGIKVDNNFRSDFSTFSEEVLNNPNYKEGTTFWFFVVSTLKIL